MTSAARFCVIHCENSTKWEPVYFSDMFRESLQRPGDLWTVCNLASNDPLPEDILMYQGIVITGSRFNCRDRETLPWFDNLCEMIQIAAKVGSPRIYGGCFGCQIIAHALGGEVDRNPTNRFILKAEKIQWGACNCCHVDSDNRSENCNSDNCDCCVPAPISTTLLQKLKVSDLRLIESHGDCVRRLPDGAILLAKSSSCECEMYLAGSNYNIWACQSHPEFDLQYAVHDRIWPAVVDQMGRLNEEEIALAKETFAVYDASDARLILDAISDYLHFQS
jgi:GMP synthase-like glutamine amidotransferase